MQKKNIFRAFLVCAYGMAPSAQAQFHDPREAQEHFRKKNYFMAMEVYKILLKHDPANPTYLHRIGICYLKTNLNKTEAIPYLERAVKHPRCSDEAFYDLGLAYQYAYRFDEAMKMYEQYREKKKGSDAEKADKQIAACQLAAEMVKFPLNVEFENLGPEINSPFPDYYPFVDPEENVLVFTTRRAGELEFDGYFPSDIYVAEAVEGGFRKAVNAGIFVNTSLDEQAVGMRHDGGELFVYSDQIDRFGDIYSSKKIARSFATWEKLGPHVNSSYLERAACISPDEKVIFFSSDRPGGRGGTDLYMVRQLPDARWALPQNLGPQVNTPDNEDFPYIASDGRTLYFSSNGLPGMGGHDLFTSEWDAETNTWTPPRNLRYPLNTPEDEMTISFSKDGAHAYVSALRKEGLGDLDIYRVKFLEEQKNYTVLRVLAPTQDSLYPFIRDTIIVVSKEKKSEVVGLYKPNQQTGFYIIALLPGTYYLRLTHRDFKPYLERITVTESTIYPPVIFKTLELTPVKRK